MLDRTLGDLNTRAICLLGMTYKPGTSTLKRSVAIQVAESLVADWVRVKTFDPQADGSSVTLPSEIRISESAYQAAERSDATVLLTEWPEFRTLDHRRMLADMTTPVLVDIEG